MLVGSADDENMAKISAGDSVMVLMDPDLFKMAQLDYGGWNDNMAEVSF